MQCWCISLLDYSNISYVTDGSSIIQLPQGHTGGCGQNRRSLMAINM